MSLARLAGGRWRFLAHHRLSKGYGEEIALDAKDFGPSEFDELVVGRWFHIEQMDTGRWWMNVGGVTVWVHADRDGRPKSVTVYGPGDYAFPESGCAYDLSWST